MFQTSRSDQSEAIRIVTSSPYSHMGPVIVRDTRLFRSRASSVSEETSRMSGKVRIEPA